MSGRVAYVHMDLTGEHPITTEPCEGCGVPVYHRDYETPRIPAGWYEFMNPSEVEEHPTMLQHTAETCRRYAKWVAEGRATISRKS